jgi:uncharacterized zinc-type alcohol dehydrogenase-like protein
MSRTIKSYAACEPNTPLKPYEYTLGDIEPDQVDIAVEYCGICHSDISMLNNDWGISDYPIIPGHEIVGRIVSAGAQVKHVAIGDRVGLGWMSQSCMHCTQCIGGDHNLCQTAEQTIVSRHGGFADHVRCHWAWAIPLPDALDVASVGPLFCGGLTVFNPLIQNNVKPTDRVGVIGIGGLGHLALQFCNKWGCEVTAFTSSENKTEEAKKFGAHHVINSRDVAALEAAAGTFDFIISTVNVPLEWESYYAALAPKGKFHLVGAVLEPLPLPAFTFISAQRSVMGSPVGGPLVTRQMLEFCARHNIAPATEIFPMSQVNEAIEHLESGQARYRIVLKNDL